MRTFHSAWRYGIFWIAVSALGMLAFFSLPIQSLIVHAYVTTYTTLHHGDLVGLLDIDLLKSLAIAMGLLGGVLALGRALATRVVRAVYASLSQRYELTDDTLRAIHGLFSRDDREGFRRDLRTVHIKQSVLDRLLGVGDLSLSTVGDQGLAIHLKRVPRPHLLKQEIMRGVNEPLSAERVLVPARSPKTLQGPSQKSLDQLPMAAPSPTSSKTEPAFSEDTALSPFTKPLTQAPSKTPTKNPN